MKNNIQRGMLFALLISVFTTGCFGPKTFFGIRSQAVNGVRSLVGWQQKIYHFRTRNKGLQQKAQHMEEGDNYGALAATLEYSRSFRPDRINDVLFGGEKLVFSGSRLGAERGEKDILADYFGLSPDFQSTVRFTPRITNVVLDFNWHQAFDRYVSGLYVQLHLPIVHTKWDLNMCEGGIRGGQAFHPAGHMAPARIEAASLAKNVTEALQGNTTFGDMREPLKFGKVFGRQNSNRVAEIHGTLGWRFVQEDWYHVGAFVRAGAPVGNEPDAEFLFEPIAGNRHHWELGGGLTSHVQIWEHDQADKRLVLYFDAVVSHLFSNTQMRSYDLKNNGPGSRYMLLSEIGTNIDLSATNQYVRRLLPAINVTTLKSKIGMDVQADIVLKVAYQRDNFEFDVGYNFWGISREKLKCRDTLPENRFGIKGDAQVYGFTVVGIAVPLNVTQSKATIRKGQGLENTDFRNFNADNPAPAQQVGPNNLLQFDPTGTDDGDLGVPPGFVQGSNPAVLLKDSDINEESALLPRAISHKLFAHFNYMWDNGDDLGPFLGGGLSGEWADTKNDKNIVPSQWAIWIKGGLSY